MSPIKDDIPGYYIEKLLAEGGMASVYLARQESLDRRVALKLLRKFDNPSQAMRFFNEGRIIASLQHRNIITIFDLGAVGERHYLAMEYLQGGDLRQRINAGMEPSQVLEIIETLASCLSFVHQKGIIHRDIKPENILFRQDGSVVLTDFGVAKQMVSNSSLTMDGIALGSPYYLSPEQAQCRELDGRADIYSLGIIAYEMFTGVKPFQGDSPLETIMAHLNAEQPELPAHLSYCEPLLERMIAVNPRDRFACAAELVDCVRQLRTNKPRQQFHKPVPRLESAKSWIPALQAVHHQLAVAAVMLLACAMLIFVFLWQPKLDPVDEAGIHTSIATPTAQATELVATTKAVATADNKLPVVVPVSESHISAMTSVEAEHTTPARKPLPSAMEALRQADAILKEYPLTMPKLQQAYDLYQLTLEKNPLYPGALRGTNNIANKFIEIQTQIQRYLKLADAAIKNNRLVPPQANNATDYYRLVLQLEPNRAEALEGLDKLARQNLAGSPTPIQSLIQE